MGDGVKGDSCQDPNRYKVLKPRNCLSGTPRLLMAKQILAPWGWTDQDSLSVLFSGKVTRNSFSLFMWDNTCISKGTNIDLNHTTDTNQHQHGLLPYFLSASRITGSV